MEVISYDIRYLHHTGEAYFLVSMELTGAESGQTVLELPFGYGPAKQLYRYLGNIACSSAEATIDIDFENHSCCISHRPGAPLCITYTLQKPNNSVPSDTLFYSAIQNCFAPILENRHFHILGICLFLYPREDAQYIVRIKWSGFPDGWTMVNSIAPKMRNEQHFTADSKDWLESVFLGGDYRLHQVLVSKKPVSIAIRGRWSFDDRVLIAFLEASIQAIRDFWNDHHFEHYMIVLNPMHIDKLRSKDHHAYESVEIGSGLLNAMTLFSTQDRTLQQLRRLIYHEQLHHWIGGKLKAGDDTTEYLYVWFNEGFTEYLTYKLMAQNSLLTLVQYISILNQKFLKPYYSSPYREMSNHDIAGRMDSSQDHLDLSYQRGYLIAFYLDMRIKASSGNKGDIRCFLTDLLSHYHKILISDDLTTFFKLLEKHILTDFCAEDFYQRHVIDGRVIPADTFCLPRHLLMRSRRIPEIEIAEDATLNVPMDDLV